MAANPFIGGVNPPDTASIGGGISQMGALSGQLNSRRTEPLISLRGGEIARVTFGSGLIYDPFNVWVEAGNPQNGGLLTGAGVRESIIPATAGNFVKIPGGGQTHFTGNFSIAVVLRWSANVGDIIYQDGTVSVAGYLMSIAAGGIAFRQSGAGVSAAAFPGGPGAAGVLSVAFGGVSGSTIFGKVNLGTIATAAGIAYVPATGDTAVGATPAGGQPYTSDIFEVWISTQTPSDALFISIANEVKTKLGITAW